MVISLLQVVFARALHPPVPGVGRQAQMEVTYLNKETGAVVARGEFYNHASGMVGGFILNAADLMMLDRIAAQVVNYSAENR